MDEIRKLINETPILQSLLFDLDLMPEQVAAGSKQESLLLGVVGAYLAGQKSKDAALEAGEKLADKDAEIAALKLTHFAAITSLDLANAEIAALRAVEQNNPFEKAASAALEILNEAFNQSNKTYNDALDANRKEPPTRSQHEIRAYVCGVDHNRLAPF